MFRVIWSFSVYSHQPGYRQRNEWWRMWGNPARRRQRGWRRRARWRWWDARAADRIDRPGPWWRSYWHTARCYTPSDSDPTGSSENTQGWTVGIAKVYFMLIILYPTVIIIVNYRKVLLLVKCSKTTQSRMWHQS